MSPTPLRSGNTAYAKTLFLIDDGATVGGVAGGFTDLESLDARNVELERLSVPALSLSLEQIAEMGREAEAALVVVGVSDAKSLYGMGILGHAAMPSHPLLYLGVNTPDGALLPHTGRILRHILVPGDFSARSGCLTSCLLRAAGRGTRVVTLMHVPDAALSKGCSPSSVGELGRVDTDWVEQLKKMLFSAGVDEVRFISPVGGAPEFAEMNPSVSLVLVGATCNAEIAQAYISAAGSLFAHRDEVPALMLTAESCLVEGRARGVA
jgi:nucleotide-binding universal stress UspA family protein